MKPNVKLATSTDPSATITKLMTENIVLQRKERVMVFES